MNHLLSSQRSKWLLGIGVVAIGAALTAKNVISYPSECMTEEMAHISEQHMNHKDPA